jgi:hypothetical protein
MTALRMGTPANEILPELNVGVGGWPAACQAQAIGDELGADLPDGGVELAEAFAALVAGQATVERLARRGQVVEIVAQQPAVSGRIVPAELHLPLLHPAHQPVRVVERQAAFGCADGLGDCRSSEQDEEGDGESSDPVPCDPHRGHSAAICGSSARMIDKISSPFVDACWTSYPTGDPSSPTSSITSRSISRVRRAGSGLGSI